MLPGLMRSGIRKPIRVVSEGILTPNLGGTVHTYTAAPFNNQGPSEDRLIVIFWNGSNNAGGAGNVSSVTFNGVAAAELVAPTGSRSATCIAWGYVPAGTTVTIVVTTTIISNGDGVICSITGLLNPLAAAAQKPGTVWNSLTSPHAMPAINIFPGNLVIYGLGTSGAPQTHTYGTAILLAQGGGAEQVSMAYKMVDAQALSFAESVTVTGAGFWGGDGALVFQ